MKKAVLFDVDGTLIDAWEFIHGAIVHTIKVHGHKMPSKKVIKDAMGHPLLAFYETVFPGLDPKLFAKTHDDFQQGKFDLGKPFPKARETLKRLKSQGFLIGVVSNRTKNSLHTTLKKAKLLEFIDVVVSAEDVAHPKPNKEHVLKTLELLRVNPKDTILVGDTDMDILAGKNAKVQTVGVTYGFAGKSIKDYNPDFVINKIEEILKIIQ